MRHWLILALLALSACGLAGSPDSAASVTQAQDDDLPTWDFESLHPERATAEFYRDQGSIAGINNNGVFLGTDPESGARLFIKFPLPNVYETQLSASLAVDRITDRVAVAEGAESAVNALTRSALKDIANGAWRGQMAYVPGSAANLRFNDLAVFLDTPAGQRAIDALASLVEGRAREPIATRTLAKTVRQGQVGLVQEFHPGKRVRLIETEFRGTPFDAARILQISAVLAWAETAMGVAIKTFDAAQILSDGSSVRLFDVDHVVTTPSPPGGRYDTSLLRAELLQIYLARYLEDRVVEARGDEGCAL